MLETTILGLSLSLVTILGRNDVVDDIRLEQSIYVVGMK